MAENDEDPVLARLRRVNEECLRTLAATLETRVNERNVDAEDARVIRLLLDEYAGAVRQVRGAAQILETRFNAAASAVRAGRRVVRRIRSNDADSD